MYTTCMWLYSRVTRVKTRKGTQIGHVYEDICAYIQHSRGTTLSTQSVKTREQVTCTHPHIM